MIVQNVGRSMGNEIHDAQDEAHREDELDAQRAIDETGFGKFNYKVIAIGGMIFINVGFCIPNMGFVLPSAACDYRLDTIAMDRLGTAQIFGMICGSCIWGCIADTKGRRVSLLACLFLQAIVDSLAAVSSNYWAFMVFRIFTGLSLSGQIAIVFTYIGEFQPSKYRKIVLAFTEVPGITGVILPPIVAWLIIPLNIDSSFSYISFKSWNLFIVIMSALPVLITGCALLTIPETPKYLASTGQYVELRRVLIAMHSQNTGNTAGEYVNLYTQTILLVKRPYMGRTVLSFTVNGVIVSVYTLTMWFPEIFQRIADYERQNPGKRSDVCIASHATAELRNRNASMIMEQNGTHDCVAAIDDHVYFDTLILGLSCIPPAIIFMSAVSRTGFRFFLAMDSLITSAVTAAMIFVNSSTQSWLLSCVWEAMMSLSMTVISCLLVEIYPTHLRVTASAMAALFGRLSAFVSNIIFGFLLDNHCTALFTLIAVHLFVSGVLCCMIPSGDEEQGEGTNSKDSIRQDPEVD